MPRKTTSLALLALIVIVAAMIAARAGNSVMAPARHDRASSTGTREPSGQTAKSAPVDPLEDVARRYALAARNWTPSTYRSAWERQIKLASGRYERALRAKRPGRREIAALHADHARSTAQVLRTERDRRAHPPNARVLVTLDETTSAAGQTIRGVTLNEVRLRDERGTWRVTGWTVIPGG
jgi:hypothetical protein